MLPCDAAQVQAVSIDDNRVTLVTTGNKGYTRRFNLPAPVPGVKELVLYSMFQDVAEEGSFQLRVMEFVVTAVAVRDNGFGQVGMFPISTLSI